MKINIELIISDVLEQSIKDCQRYLEENDVGSFARNFLIYINHLRVELSKILRLGVRQIVGFDPATEEVHPDEVGKFIACIHVHMGQIGIFQQELIKKLSLYNLPIIESAKKEIFVPLKKDFENKLNRSRLLICKISLEELRSRYYWGIAKGTAKVTLTLSSAIACYFFPPLLLATQASMVQAVATYSVVNGVTFGVNKILCNTIDGKRGVEVLDNVPGEMGVSALMGGVCGAVVSASSIQAVKSVAHVTQKGASIASVPASAAKSAVDTTSGVIRSAFQVANIAFFSSSQPHALHDNHEDFSEDVLIILNALQESCDVFQKPQDESGFICSK